MAAGARTHLQVCIFKLVQRERVEVVPVRRVRDDSGFGIAEREHETVERAAGEFHRHDGAHSVR